MSALDSALKGPHPELAHPLPHSAELRKAEPQAKVLVEAVQRLDQDAPDVSKRSRAGWTLAVMTVLLQVSTWVFSRNRSHHGLSELG
jgi:hypothetical protein